MKLQVPKLSIFMIFSVLSFSLPALGKEPINVAGEFPGKVDAVSLDQVIFLRPGDSKSVEFEFNGAGFDPEAWHVAPVLTIACEVEIENPCENVESCLPTSAAEFLDLLRDLIQFNCEEIRNLTINISPRENPGAEIRYLTTGLFLGFSESDFEFLEPRFSDGFESVTYVANVSSTVFAGLIFTELVMAQSEHFEFPLEMTMTLTLSNP